MAEPLEDKKPDNMETCQSVRSMAQGTVDVLASNQLVVDQAIDTVGMGRYQWQLLFSCGFGFLVDQVHRIYYVSPTWVKEAELIRCEIPL